MLGTAAEPSPHPCSSSPQSLSVLGITGQRICLPPQACTPQRLRQLSVHLIVKNLRFRFKKFNHKMTSPRPECAHSVPSCCPPITSSYPEGLHSPAVSARLQESRGSAHPTAHGWTPHPQLGEMGQEPAEPRSPLHHSSSHHSPPITKKLHKDNLDVFIVFLFTSHKAGQKAECEHGTRASDTFIKEHRSRRARSAGR